MNVVRLADALREIADALVEDRAKPLRSSSTKLKAVRRIVAAPPDEDVDDVTRARARRIIRERGFVKGDS